jgi:hypothetical protein
MFVVPFRRARAGPGTVCKIPLMLIYSTRQHYERNASSTLWRAW